MTECSPGLWDVSMRQSTPSTAVSSMWAGTLSSVSSTFMALRSSRIIGNGVRYFKCFLYKFELKHYVML